MEVSGSSPTIRFSDTTADAYDFWIHVNSNRFYVVADRDHSGSWDSPWAIELNAGTDIGYLFGSQIVTAGNYDGLGITPEARSITAGNGLTGGGNLSANRTLTLGTPGSITNSTGNSVTSTSHTHALGFVAAEVYTGLADSDTNLPLGHLVMVHDGSTGAVRNAAKTIRLMAGDSYRYIASGTGAALTGVWRSRGSETDHRLFLFQRVA